MRALRQCSPTAPDVAVLLGGSQGANQSLEFFSSAVLEVIGLLNLFFEFGPLVVTNIWIIGF